MVVDTEYWLLAYSEIAETKKHQTEFGGGIPMIRETVVAALLAGIHLNCFAGTVVCGGTVVQLAYHANNSFMLRLSSMNAPVFFCNPDSNWTVTGAGGYATGPQTCKTLYATFLAAKLTGKSFGAVYFDGDSVPAACNAWGPWLSANIRYLEH